MAAVDKRLLDDRAREKLEREEAFRAAIPWDDPIEKIAISASAAWAGQMAKDYPGLKIASTKWDQHPESTRVCWRAAARAMVEKYGLPVGLTVDAADGG